MRRSMTRWLAALGVCALSIALIAFVVQSAPMPQIPETDPPAPVATATAVADRPAADLEPPSSEPPAPAAFGAAMMEGPAVGGERPATEQSEETAPDVLGEEPGPRAPVVAIDPGHGGAEVGAAHRNAAGYYDLAEKNANLEIALRLAALLEAVGYGVALTRAADHPVNDPPLDRNGDDRINVRDDLQARVNIANAARADVFISIHNNGHSNPSESGTEVWYSPSRPFAEKNLTLAKLAQSSLIESLARAGYRTRDRGIKDDTYFRIWNGRPYNLFVLGPPRPDGNWKPHATEMPGILGESLFVSNHVEAALLQQERILQAIAEGYRDALDAFFEIYPVGAGGS